MVAAVSERRGGAGEGPEIRLETITPQQAEKYLAANGVNRSVNETWVNSLARDILAGRHELAGDTIKFAKSGRLLDGQHRLQAIVKAGRPIQLFVCYGLRETAMDVIDRGRQRSVGDLLRINMGDRMQGGNVNRIAAMCLAIARLETGAIDQGKMRLTYGEAAEIYKRYENDIRWALEQIGHRIEPANSSGGAPVLAAFAFCRRIDIDRMEKLAFQYKHGEPSDGRSRMASQVRLLRTAVVNAFKASTHVRRELTLRTLRCIEAYLKNEDLQLLKVDANVIGRILEMRAAALGRR